MRRLLAILTFVAACGGATEPETAADPCTNWNTQGFFTRASAEDVANCIRTGSDVTGRNEDLQSPICMAAQFTSDPEVINVLIRNGASAHDWCAFNSWERSNCARATVLHVAASVNEHPAVFQALIDAGAPVNAIGGPGWTALSVAWLWHAPPEVVAVLERNGATGSIEIDESLCS